MLPVHMSIAVIALPSQTSHIHVHPSQSVVPGGLSICCFKVSRFHCSYCWLLCFMLFVRLNATLCQDRQNHAILYVSYQLHTYLPTPYFIAQFSSYPPFLCCSHCHFALHRSIFAEPTSLIFKIAEHPPTVLPLHLPLFCNYAVPLSAVSKHLAYLQNVFLSYFSGSNVITTSSYSFSLCLSPHLVGCVHFLSSSFFLSFFLQFLFVFCK